MRLLFLVSLIAVWLPTAAHADSAAFNRQLFLFLQANSSGIRDGLKHVPTTIGVKFSIDRDGKLLSAEVDQSSGSAEDDADVLVAVRHMPSFPQVPDDLQVPYEIKATIYFKAHPRFGSVELKWPNASATSDAEVAFRRGLVTHVRTTRPLLLDDEKNMGKNARAFVAFSIDRDGKLLDTTISKSLGVKAADDQIVAWLRSMPPFPRIPPELNAPMRLTAEIVFGPPAYPDEEHIKKLINGVCRGC